MEKATITLGEIVLLATYTTQRTLEGFILKRKAAGGHKVTIHLQDADIIDEDNHSITVSGVLAYDRDPERFYGSDRTFFFEGSKTSKTKISHHPFAGAARVAHGNIYIGEV